MGRPAGEPGSDMVLTEYNNQVMDDGEDAGDFYR